MPELEKLKNIITDNTASIVPFDLNKKNLVILDLSEANEELHQFNLLETDQFTKYIFNKLEQNNTPVGIGKYNEDRIVYKSLLFNSDQGPRSIHIGIDIWAEAGTKIFSPLDAKVHSFKNNSAYLDYGPTIILEHSINEIAFYTLYGHLSVDSITNLKEGQIIKIGEEIARMGEATVNGTWPPHLHFQIITDMNGKKGDFPGVVSPSKREKYLEICPDPNLILRIESLKNSA